MAFIVLGRVEHFRTHPSELLAPRYFFWSSLFWAGLMLAFILAASATKWLRWPVLVFTLAMPILAFPLHYKEGLHWRYGQYLAESAATSLINDVRDEKQIKILFRDPKQVYRLASLLRAKRLDMFAAGLQDWIGQRETSLFGGRHAAKGFKGHYYVKEVVKGADGEISAKVTGLNLKEGGAIPKVFVLVDPEGMVCGVARSWTTSGLMNRMFYGGKFSSSNFLGYIRGYDPKQQYLVRCADDEILSDEHIVVEGQ